MGPLGLMGRPVSGGFDGGVFVVDNWQSRRVVIYVLSFGFAVDFHQGTFNHDQCTCCNDVCMCVCVGV